MRNRLGIGGVAALLTMALTVSACSAPLRYLWQHAPITAPNSSSVAQPTATVAVSPTAPPMLGPMGTLTAIAELLASPTPNRTAYEIVNRGRPHFLIFHAWW